MKNLTITLLLVLLLPVLAIAQYNPLVDDKLSLNNTSSPSLDETVSLEPKSEKTAQMLTIAVPSAAILIGSVFRKSTFGFTMITTGIIFGPSAGNIYAENKESVIKGISSRAAGLGFMAAGAYLGFFESIFEPHFKNGEHSLGFWPKTLIIGGAGLIIYSWVFDYFKSAKNVREYNRGYEKPVFAFSPVYFPKEKALGISVSLSF